TVRTQLCADQADIWTDSVRLLRELEARNRELTEALEQQPATGEILKVISSSPTNEQPVFDTIIRNAVRLCDGTLGVLFRYDEQLMDIGALYNIRPGGEVLFRSAYPQPANRDNPRGRPIVDPAVVRVDDIETAEYSEAAKERARASGYRSGIAVPMIREGVPIGSIAVARRESGWFPESYVALLKTFADQAVIAIENVRLFKELEARNMDLTGALEQQPATAEILRVISGSPTDIRPVFDAVLDRALTLCEASNGSLYQLEDGALRHVGLRGPHLGTEVGGVFPLASGTGRAVLEK